MYLFDGFDTEDTDKDLVVVMVWDESLTCGMNRWSCYEGGGWLEIGFYGVVCGFGCLDGVYLSISL
ncbi:hypothetical protein [Candidatus Hodgkinia cicadicola]|uniref:hypothetical protein n=1 Tax=Candidatus Hodgkinia cicadicola TaxID=573658 RepID=UPI0011BA70C2